MGTTPPEIKKSGYDPLWIADYFIALHKEKGGLTLLQLLKLTYIAHGFHLAITDSPLSNVEPEAWQYGPVFRDIYREYKKVDWPIKEVKYEKEHSKISIDAKEIMTMVSEKYGYFTGWQLVALTHDKDTPWKQTFGKGEGDGDPIKNDKIKEYYNKVLDESG